MFPGYGVEVAFEELADRLLYEPSESDGRLCEEKTTDQVNFRFCPRTEYLHCLIERQLGSHCYRLLARGDFNHHLLLHPRVPVLQYAIRAIGYAVFGVLPPRPAIRRSGMRTH